MVGSTSEAESFGADRHAVRGLNSESCHGPDQNNPQYPDENTCIQCHSKTAVADKTKDLSPNPHAAPHNGDCTLCHMQHEEPVNYCNQCHKFTYSKVP